MSIVHVQCLFLLFCFEFSGNDRITTATSFIIFKMSTRKFLVVVEFSTRNLDIPTRILLVLYSEFQALNVKWTPELKVALSVTWRKMKYSRFFSIYTSNKVMQVCLITALIVKRYKRNNYSFVIILLNIRLI
jgi:hypothetical protein